MRKVRLCALAAAVLLMTASAAHGFVTTAYLGDDVACKGESIQGDWVGKVGADGYHLLYWNGNESQQSYPDYLDTATTTTGNKANWKPAGQTPDVRACIDITQTQRAASAWYTYSATPDFIRIPVKADKVFILGVYMLDWDRNGSRTALLGVCDKSEEAAPPVIIATGSYYNPTKWFFWRVWASSGDTVSISVLSTGAEACVAALSFDASEPAFASSPSLLRMFTNSSAETTISANPAGAPGIRADVTTTDPAVLASIMAGGTDILASGGDDALTFADGASCDQGPVTVNAPAAAGNTTIEIAESDSADYTQQGVASGSVRIEVVERVVRLNGFSVIALPFADVADRGVEIVDATLTAPGNIPVTLGTPSGSSATYSADGDIFIADGATTSDGSIYIQSSPDVAGPTSVDVTVGNGFVFQETGTNTITITTFVLPEPVIYVSGAGSDETGLGTQASPFRTLTKALATTPAILEVRVLPGLYDSLAGEVFPLNVPAGVSVIGTMGEVGDEFDSSVVDAGLSAARLLQAGGAASYAFTLAATPAGT
ncbi:MAG TPA: DUF1565 domain-containing protein, partial [Phycisphaerae bacterium]|nr:DUF1565 domain-containing protein [Phycisphaerae bacterium]